MEAKPSVNELHTEEVVGGCVVQHKEMTYNNIKIHFVQCGDSNGQLVLLLHGFPNFWYVWKNQFKILAEAGYHVIAPDLRGFNASSKPEGIENYGRDLVLLDMLQLIDIYGAGQQVIVVGHDWGGVLTWALAEDFPSKICKIIIVNMPHLTMLHSALWSNIRQIIRSWYIFFFQVPWIPVVYMRSNRFGPLRAVLKAATSQPLSDEEINRHVKAYSFPGALKAAVNLYRAAYNGHWHQKGRPSPIELPVTVLWGEQDKYFDTELSVPPREVAANTRVVLIPKVSHWPMWDNPSLFNQLLLKALC